jgi:hypothetical protein
MKFHIILLLIILIPSLAMTMEKAPYSVLGKRNAQEAEIDLDENRIFKTPKLPEFDEDRDNAVPIDLQEDTLISLPTPLIAACNQLTPVSTLPALTDNEKRYKCPYEGCNYAATRNGHLNTHIRKHTGKRPYKCTYEGCNYASTQKGNLDRHIKRRHPRMQGTLVSLPTSVITAFNQNTPVSTPLSTPTACNYIAIPKVVLTGHMRIDEKPYQCTYEGCNYATAKKNSLIYHMKSKHPNATSQDNIISLPTPIIAALSKATSASTPLTAVFENIEKECENLEEEL